MGFEAPYEEPVVRDYGDLLAMTQAGKIEALEDLGPNLPMLDGSNEPVPVGGAAA
jgi:hypothetical protein